MSSPCDTCAFTKGSEANLEPHNYLKGVICVLGPSPFQCHHTKAGERIDSDPTAHDRMSAAEYRGRGVRICEGWRREVRALAETGYYKDRPMLTRALAQIGLEELYIFLNSEEGSEDKLEAKERLHRVCQKLGEKRKRFES